MLWRIEVSGDVTMSSVVIISSPRLGGSGDAAVTRG
jgi:hypothetical protein